MALNAYSDRLGRARAPAKGGRRGGWAGQGLLFFLTLWVLTGLAGALEVGVRYYSEPEGLPVGQVTALAQTEDGCLKVGTPAGLVGFDGVEFRPEAGSPTGAVRTLFVAGPAGEWGGLMQGGVGFLNRNGAFLPVPAEYKGPHLWGRLFRGPGGEFWGAVRGGVLRVDSAGKSKLFGLPGVGDGGMPTLMGVTRCGSVWVIHEGGLWKNDQGAWTLETGLPRLNLNLGNGFCEAADGTLWLSFARRLARKKPGDTTWTPLATEVGNGERGFTENLAITSTGRVWVSTSMGGLWVSDDGERFQPAVIEGRPLDVRIECLLVDREDQLWAGTKERGLAKVSPASLTMVSLKQGDLPVKVTALLDAGGGAWYVGTHEQGIRYWRDGKSEPWMLGDEANRDPFGNAFLREPDGGIYAGAGFGLYHVRDRKRLPEPRIDAVFNSGDSVMSLCWAEQPGQFYAGLRRGKLYRVENGKPVAVPELWNGMLTAMARTPDGMVWGATTGRGVRKVGEKAYFLGREAGLRSNTVVALHVDGRGRLWAGTVGGGLSVLRQGRFFTFGLEEGLVEETVNQITDDGLRLWIAGNKGIFSLTFADLDAVLEGRERQVAPLWLARGEHLYSTPLPPMTPAKSAEGVLAFGTNRGFVLVHPTPLPAAPPAPEVRIQSILMDETPADAGAKDLRVPPGTGRLQVDWTGLALNLADRLRFRYRMAGHEDAWRDARQERRAVYGGLPPGDYVFEVAARVGAGAWNPHPARFSVRVIPFFWQTWWFRGLAMAVPLGMAVGFGYLLQRRKRQALAAQLAQVQAVEAERHRIARDLHDHLGGPMTEMALYSQLAQAKLAGNAEVTQYLERILQTAQHGARALGEIVWATDPAHDTLSSFVKQVVEMVKTSSPLCHRMLVPSELPPVQLSAAVRQQLYLTLKEALNNIHKHAGATEITLRISCQGGALNMALEDNGCGFDPSVEPPFGSNGLKNMKERLTQAGGKLTIESKPGAGTAVVLTVPLDRLA